MEMMEYVMYIYIFIYVYRTFTYIPLRAPHNPQPVGCGHVPRTIQVVEIFTRLSSAGDSDEEGEQALEARDQ